MISVLSYDALQKIYNLYTKWNKNNSFNSIILTTVF